MVFSTTARIDTDGRECNKCGDYKPWSEFTRNSRGPRGRRSECRACRKAYSAEYYKLNSAEILARNVAYMTEHREEMLAYQAAYRAENAEKIKRWIAEWAAANPERRRAMKSRRRQRESVGMDAFDRELSAAYRRAIADDPCFYCGDRTERMHDEHFIPLAIDGTDHWHNLVRACSPCNWSKGTKSGEEFILCMRSYITGS